MKRVIFVICAMLGAGGAAFAGTSGGDVFTDGTCIKSGIPGLSSSKSGCDSIGGVWRSHKSAEMIGAASQNGNAAKLATPPKAARQNPNANEGTPGQQH